MAYEQLVNKLMNETPSNSQKKDLEETYNKLYPQMANDFVHVSDLMSMLEYLKAELLQIKNQLDLDRQRSAGGVLSGPSAVDIQFSQEKAKDLIVYEGEMKINGTVARQDEKIGGEGSSQMEEFQDLLDPDNPTAE